MHKLYMRFYLVELPRHGPILSENDVEQKRFKVMLVLSLKLKIRVKL
jgi:hypothetical protein